MHAVLLTGGSAFGLAAADGVVRWLERNGRGYDDPGRPRAARAGGRRLRPDERRPDAPARARPRARPPARRRGEDPELGSVGAGTGAAVGKLRGREFAVKSGVGLAKQHLPQGAKLAALAVVNAFGDVIGEDGQVLAGTRADDGSFIGTTKLLRTRLIEPPSFRRGEPLENTTLVCLMTDAELTKAECGIVAKMAHAGMARAVDPVHSSADGDVVFTLATGTRPRVEPLIVGVVAAALTAEAIRDACRQATTVAGIPSLSDLGRMSENERGCRCAQAMERATSTRSSRCPIRSVEFVNPPTAVEPGTRHGHDGLRTGSRNAGGLRGPADRPGRMHRPRRPGGRDRGLDRPGKGSGASSTRSRSVPRHAARRPDDPLRVVRRAGGGAARRGLEPLGRELLEAALAVGLEQLLEAAERLSADHDLGKVIWPVNSASWRRPTGSLARLTSAKTRPRARSRSFALMQRAQGSVV